MQLQKDRNHKQREKNQAFEEANRKNQQEKGSEEGPLIDKQRKSSFKEMKRRGSHVVQKLFKDKTRKIFVNSLR